MGTCAGISKKKTPFKLTPSVKFSFKHKLVTEFSQYPYRSFQLDLNESLNKNSAYTSSNTNIYLVGGTSMQSVLSNDVIKLNLSTLSAEYLPSLPFTSKFGELHIYENYIYYIGGVRIHNETTYPTPFLRLNLTSNTWEILEEPSRPGKKLSISSQLYRPGSCIQNSSIFIISGEILIPNYIKSFNSKSYKLDLNTLEVTLLPYSSPICIGPKCIQLQKDFLIFGTDSKNSSFCQKLSNFSNPTQISLGFDVKHSTKLFKTSNKIIFFCKGLFNTLNPVKMNLRTMNSVTLVAPSSTIRNFTNLKAHPEAPFPQPLLSTYYSQDN